MLDSISNNEVNTLDIILAILSNPFIVDDNSSLKNTVDDTLATQSSSKKVKKWSKEEK